MKDFDEFDEMMRAESYGFDADRFDDEYRRNIADGLPPEAALSQAVLVSAMRADVALLRAYHEWVNG